MLINYKRKCRPPCLGGGSTGLDLVGVAAVVSQRPGCIGPTGLSPVAFILVDNRGVQVLKPHEISRGTFSGRRVVAFELAPFFHALRHIDVPMPDVAMEVRLAERLLSLGLFHATYFEEHQDLAAAAQAAHLGLPATLDRYGLPPPRHTCHPPMAMFPAPEDVSFAAMLAKEEARSALALLECVVDKIESEGLLELYEQVELPCRLLLLEMGAEGVRVNPARIAEVRRDVRLRRERARARLAELGLTRPQQLNGQIGLLRKHGIELQGMDRGELKDKTLRSVAHRSDVARWLLEYRVASRLSRDKVLNGRFVREGRMYPQYTSLGTETGRVTAKEPAIQSLPRVYRDIVVADDGMAIFVLDIVSADVAVAAALAGDWGLLKACLLGDAYIKAARCLPSGLVPPGQERDLAKQVFISALYGQSSCSLHTVLGVSREEARRTQRAMFEPYPELVSFLEEQPGLLKRDGYARCAGGFRRRRPATGPLSSWERRWATNAPIQGSLAVAGKEAMLNQVLRPMGGKVLIPMHDGFVLQVPLGRLDEARTTAAEVVVEAVRGVLPDLEVRVKTDVATPPTCWPAEAKRISDESALVEEDSTN